MILNQFPFLDPFQKEINWTICVTYRDPCEREIKTDVQIKR